MFRNLRRKKECLQVKRAGRTNRREKEENGRRGAVRGGGGASQGEGKKALASAVKHRIVGDSEGPFRPLLAWAIRYKNRLSESWESRERWRSLQRKRKRKKSSRKPKKEEGERRKKSPRVKTPAGRLIISFFIVRESYGAQARIADARPEKMQMKKREAKGGRKKETANDNCMGRRFNTFREVSRVESAKKKNNQN